MSCSSFSTGFCDDAAAVAGVASFNARTGAVLPADSDYDSTLIPDSTVGLAGTRVSQKLADAKSQIDAAAASAQQGIDDAAQAQTDADQAILDASAAQSTANTGVTNAATAQGTANTALANAATAQTTANTGVTNAATAQSAANAAQSTANTGVANAATAQGTANTALANAATAQSTANAKLSDAPNNGTLYARKSVGWVQPASQDVTDVLFGDVATGLDQLDTAIGTLNTDVTNLTTVAFTQELTAAFTPGGAPSYLPLKDFPLALGTSYILNGWLHLTSGPASAPLSGAISFEGSACCLARRTSGGVVTVSGTPSTVGGTIGGLATQWVVSGTNARLQVRTTAGAVCRVEFRYTWSALAVP